MHVRTIAAVALIVIGALGLGYGGLGYAEETQQVDVGPIHVSVDETDRVNVPVWIGAAGIVLMLVSRRRS